MVKVKRKDHNLRRNKRARSCNEEEKTCNMDVMNENEDPLNVTLSYKAPETLTSGVPKDALIPFLSESKEECIICREDLLQENSVTLAVCGHSFRKECIDQCLEMKPQCPICRKSIGSPRGKSPSGKMCISTESFDCSGYEGHGTISIAYNLKSAKQKDYHDNPGVCHSAKVDTAYLPNTEEGCKLLKRLKFAFMHGLSFIVGTSATTGRTNQCTWSSIHHKTRLYGGSVYHGYPDEGYFLNSNEELDSLGVPPEHQINDDGSAV